MSFAASYDHGDDNKHYVGAASDGEAGRRAGISFNPAGNGHIECVKGFTAALMQAVIRAREAEEGRFAQVERPTVAEVDRHKDAMRNFATALTQIEAGKMFAVNGIAATFPKG